MVQSGGVDPFAIVSQELEPLQATETVGASVTASVQSIGTLVQ